jgi:hypothetical protein
VTTTPDTTSSDQTTGSGLQAIALVDLLDRLLGTGVVLSGDILISLAGVDLVEVRLRALIRTVSEEEKS